MKKQANLANLVICRIAWFIGFWRTGFWQNDLDTNLIGKFLRDLLGSYSLCSQISRSYKQKWAWRKEGHILIGHKDKCANFKDEKRLKWVEFSYAETLICLRLFLKFPSRLTKIMSYPNQTKEKEKVKSKTTRDRQKLTKHGLGRTNQRF